MLRIRPYLRLAVAGLLLVGCASQAPREAGEGEPPTVEPAPPIATLTPTATPSATPMPTATPTITPTPTITATPPALSDTLLTEDFFFGESSVPGCELPCWQGLVVGQSGKAEIQRMFDDVLAFHGSRQFIPDNPPEPVRLPSAYYGAGFGWDIPISDPDRDAARVSVNVYYERKTFTLAALEIRSSYLPFSSNVSPQRVLRELGTPSEMFVLLAGTERGDILRLSLFIIYSQGYHFMYPETYIPVEPTGDRVQFCLSDRYWFYVYDTSSVVVDILGPLPERRSDLTPLQEYLLPYSVQGVVPLSDYFRVTLEDLAQEASAGGDMCLQRTGDG